MSSSSKKSQGPRRSESPRRRNGRVKELNVVYFVDSAKTRSFKIPLRSVSLLLVLAGMVVTWSLASIYTLHREISHNQSLQADLAQALAVIFEYQTRYDSVYEEAYPDKVGAPTKPVAKDPKDPPAEKQQVAATKKEKKKPTKTLSAKAPPPAATKKAAPPAPTEIKDRLSIEQAVFKHSNDNLELKFFLRNKDTSGRAEGVLWAVAEIVLPDQTKRYVAAPPGVVVDGSGEVNSTFRTNKYRIRNYKSERFSFPLRGLGPGVIDHVRIVLQDAKGDRADYRFPVNKRLSAPPPPKPSPVENNQGADQGVNPSGATRANG